MIGLYQEPGWETVTALFLPETTDSLFLRLRPSHGPTGSWHLKNRNFRLADNAGVVSGLKYLRKLFIDGNLR